MSASTRYLPRASSSPLAQALKKAKIKKTNTDRAKKPDPWDRNKRLGIDVRSIRIFSSTSGDNANLVFLNSIGCSHLWQNVKASSPSKCFGAAGKFRQHIRSSAMQKGDTLTFSDLPPNQEVIVPGITSTSMLLLSMAEPRLDYRALP